MTRIRSMARRWRPVGLFSAIARGWERTRGGFNILAGGVTPRQLRADSRGSVAGYALLAIAVMVVIGAAVFIGLSGGVLDGDTGDTDVNDSDPSVDTDPDPVEDDDDDGDENDSEAPGGDGSDGNETDGGVDDGNETDTGDDIEYASFSGSVSVRDLGPATEGGISVFNRSSGDFAGIQRFENGSSFSFEKLAPGHTYEVEINVDQAPPEEHLLRPDPGAFIDRQFEVGHKFSGAESFVSNWTVELRDGESFTNGKTLYDSEGNTYWSWDSSPERYKNVYLAANNGSYTNFASEGWKYSHTHFGPNTFGGSENIPIKGLGGVEERTYLGEVPRKNGTGDVYQYSIPPMEDRFNVDVGATVHVEPETGYVTYIKFNESQSPDDNAIVFDEKFISDHDDTDFTAIPEDFPLDDLPEDD